MTDEQIAEADEREKHNARAQREAKKAQARTTRGFNRLSNSLRPFVPPQALAVLHDLVYQPLRVKLEELKIQYASTIAECAVGLAFILPVALIAHVLSKISHLLVIIFYVAACCYLDEGRGGFILLITIWTVNTLRKMFCPETRVEPYRGHYYAVSQAKIDSNKWTAFDFYFSMAIVLVGSYLIHTFEMALSFSLLFALVGTLILARQMSGVGANSTLGVVVFVLIYIGILVSLPGLITSIKAAVVHPVMPHQAPPQDNWWSFMLRWESYEHLRFSMDPRCLSDYIRKGVGYIPGIWCMIDDVTGPGIALLAAVDLSSKREITRPIGAAIYNGWWIGLALEIFMYWACGQVHMLGLIITTTVIMVPVWRYVAEPTWGGRGAGAVLTNTRSRFGIIFGNGAQGLRVSVLMVALVTASICHLMKFENNAWVAMSLLAMFTLGNERHMAIWLGILTLNPTLIVRSYMTEKPMTQSLTDNTVDAGQAAG